MLYNLRPASQGAFDSYVLAAGASKPVAVDPGAYPESHDDATTYIQSPSGTAGTYVESFIVGNKPPIGFVNGLKAGLRAQVNAGTHDGIVYARFGGTDGAGNTHAITASWSTFGPTAIGRPGGGTWVKGDIADPTLEIKFSYTSPGGTLVDVSSLWFQLDFRPPGGGYQAAVAGFVGAAVGLHEMAEIASELFRRTRIRLEPKEFLEAWNELKYDPRRKVFC